MWIFTNGGSLYSFLISVKNVFFENLEIIL
jgi:hypothetical protein